MILTQEQMKALQHKHEGKNVLFIGQGIETAYFKISEIIPTIEITDGTLTIILRPINEDQMSVHSAVGVNRHIVARRHIKVNSMKELRAELIHLLINHVTPQSDAAAIIGDILDIGASYEVHLPENDIVSRAVMADLMIMQQAGHADHIVCFRENGMELLMTLGEDEVNLTFNVYVRGNLFSEEIKTVYTKAMLKHTLTVYKHYFSDGGEARKQVEYLMNRLSGGVK